MVQSKSSLMVKGYHWLLRFLVLGIAVSGAALFPKVSLASLRVVVLTDAAGLGDRSFNDACWQGAEKAKQEFGLETKFLQSREQADYVANLTLASQHADVVVTLGYLFADAVRKVAPYFPQTRFVHVEGEVVSPNVVSFDFRSQDAGFLAGLVTGLFTRNLKVGVIGGMQIPPVEAYVSGFLTGIKTAESVRRQEVETKILWAGSFDDPIKGKSLAQTLISQYVDVIFKVAGNTGVGVFEAVRGTDDVFLVAEDMDQDAEFPGKVLTSALKRMDIAVYDALANIVKGKFQPGHYMLGASDGAVDITDMKYSRDLFSPADLQYIEKARHLLKEGKLSIPEKQSEVKKFNPPDLQ